MTFYVSFPPKKVIETLSRRIILCPRHDLFPSRSFIRCPLSSEKRKQLLRQRSRYTFSPLTLLLSAGSPLRTTQIATFVSHVKPSTYSTQTENLINLKRVLLTQFAGHDVLVLLRERGPLLGEVPQPRLHPRPRGGARRHRAARLAVDGTGGAFAWKE